MPLSCECGSWEPEPGDIVWEAPEDFTEYPARRTTRCVSCRTFIRHTLINGGDCVAEIKRWKVPKDDIQDKIYGEDGEIPLASHWLCEACAGIFFSLEDLGFCVNPTGDMRDMLKDYHRDYGSETK